jgi:hypothetical protein
MQILKKIYRNVDLCMCIVIVILKVILLQFENINKIIFIINQFIIVYMNNKSMVSGKFQVWQKKI